MRQKWLDSFGPFKRVVLFKTYNDDITLYISVEADEFGPWYLYYIWDGDELIFSSNDIRSAEREYKKFVSLRKRELRNSYKRR